MMEKNKFVIITNTIRIAENTFSPKTLVVYKHSDENKLFYQIIGLSREMIEDLKGVGVQIDDKDIILKNIESGHNYAKEFTINQLNHFPTVDKNNDLLKLIREMKIKELLDEN